MEFLHTLMGYDEPSAAVRSTSQTPECDIVNLTGKPIHFVRVENGDLVRGDVLESTGPVPEAVIEYAAASETVITTSSGVRVPLLHDSTTAKKTKVVRYLREPKENTLFIVSLRVAQALPERQDLMVLGEKVSFRKVRDSTKDVVYYHGIVDPWKNRNVYLLSDDDDDDD